jgi:excisionase family DNA binding protein
LASSHPTVARRPPHVAVLEAADLLSVSDRTIRRWIEAEKVPHLKLPSGGCIKSFT